MTYQKESEITASACSSSKKFSQFCFSKLDFFLFASILAKVEVAGFFFISGKLVALVSDFFFCFSLISFYLAFAKEIYDYLTFSLTLFKTTLLGNCEYGAS
jgi:hypothetical protein